VGFSGERPFPVPMHVAPGRTIERATVRCYLLAIY
jgi:hypothetical protein